MTIPNLADGTYLITARQVDLAGNNGQSQGFGSPGTVIIDGTDANDHGFFDTATQTNQEGWAYIEKALNSIAPNVTNGNKVVVALGTTPSQTTGLGGPGGGGGGQAGGAIFHAFRQSNLPALGWTLVYIDGATTDLNANGQGDLDEFLSGLPVTAQSFLPGTDGILGTADDVLGTVPNVQFGGAVPAGGLGTGILYVTTANNSNGDIDTAELNIINTHGDDIARFVTGGGGLFSHAESAGSSFVQIAASPNGATEAGNTVTITTTAAHGLTAGQVVTITAFGGGGGGIAAGYRGTFTIASVPSPTTFTYTNPISGLAPSGGGFVVIPGQGAYGWLTSIFPGIAVVQDSGLLAQRHHHHPGGDAGLPRPDRGRPVDRALAQLLQRRPRGAGAAGHRHQHRRQHRAADPDLHRRDGPAPDGDDRLHHAGDADGPRPAGRQRQLLQRHRRQPAPHVVGSNTDNYTNDTSPTFDIGAIEEGTVVTLLRDGTPVASRDRPGRHRRLRRRSA